MKITKTSKRMSELKTAKEIANKGCDKCPCCGEIYNGLPLEKSWYQGRLFRKGRYMKIDCYTCDSCGAEWESEPYEYE